MATTHENGAVNWYGSDFSLSAFFHME